MSELNLFSFFHVWISASVGKRFDTTRKVRKCFFPVDGKSRKQESRVRIPSERPVIFHRRLGKALSNQCLLRRERWNPNLTNIYSQHWMRVFIIPNHPGSSVSVGIYTHPRGLGIRHTPYFVPGPNPITRNNYSFNRPIHAEIANSLRKWWGSRLVFHARFVQWHGTVSSQ